jgi:hypothetical protein
MHVRQKKPEFLEELFADDVTLNMFPPNPNDVEFRRSHRTLGGESRGWSRRPCAFKVGREARQTTCGRPDRNSSQRSLSPSLIPVSFVVSTFSYLPTCPGRICDQFWPVGYRPKPSPIAIGPPSQRTWRRDRTSPATIDILTLFLGPRDPALPKRTLILTIDDQTTPFRL